MLSAEQKKLKESANPQKAGLAIREAKSRYDINRVTELWANLTMVQQMQGNDIWLQNSRLSGLSWNEYIQKLVDSRTARVLVFENEEIIFGFAYLVLQNMNATKSNRKMSLKAIIKELYVEPGYRKQARSMSMAEMMRQALKNLDIEYFEFDVADL